MLERRRTRVGGPELPHHHATFCEAFGEALLYDHFTDCVRGLAVQHRSVVNETAAFATTARSLIADCETVQHSVALNYQSFRLMRRAYGFD